MNTLDETLATRFIMGICTDEELEQVNVWLNENEENQRTLFELETVYRSIYQAKRTSIQIEEAFARVHQRIDTSRKSSLKQFHFTKIYRYVACLFLLAVTILSVFLWGNNLWNSPDEPMLLAQTNAKTTLCVTLSDGTKVWLNHNSSLQYPAKFHTATRKVHLEGEGYFEVAKNKHKPFVVENKALTVKVLGTVFNFKNNVSQKRSEVSLIEGSVEVKSNYSEGQIVLTPGQKALLNYNTGHITVENINYQTDAVWHQQNISFANATITEIFNKLETIYDIHITLAPNVNISSTYSGNIQYKKDADVVLQLLQNTLPIKIKKTKENHYRATSL